MQSPTTNQQMTIVKTVKKLFRSQGIHILTPELKLGTKVYIQYSTSKPNTSQSLDTTEWGPDSTTTQEATLGHLEELSLPQLDCVQDDTTPPGYQHPPELTLAGPTPQDLHEWANEQSRSTFGQDEDSSASLNSKPVTSVIGQSAVIDQASTSFPLLTPAPPEPSIIGRSKGPFMKWLTGE